MSYSTAQELEVCARRWGLSHADYSSSLGRPTYPRRPRKGLLAGQVAHLALQRIANALQSAGCVGPHDPGVVEALRSMGGISRVLEACARHVTAAYEGDPRAAPFMGSLELELMRRLPTLRQLVQGYLQRIFGISETPTRGVTHRGVSRGPLPPGFHSEVRLAPPGIPWIGWADAIKLGPEHCEVIDYKSGLEDRTHEDQLRLYALLWWRDTQLNPEGRLATHLTIVYPGVSQSIPAPDALSLANLEADLRQRASRLVSSLSEAPPAASVSVGNCRHCDVKHLCSDYWLPAARPRLIEQEPSSIRALEVQIDGQLGIRSWSATVAFDSLLEAGTEAVLIGSAAKSFRPGAQLRLIDARIEESADGQPLVHLTSTTEIYLLEES